jgi:hypothetical protein
VDATPLKTGKGEECVHTKANFKGGTPAGLEPALFLPLGHLTRGIGYNVVR